jgi:hypothetical protein
MKTRIDSCARWTRLSLLNGADCGFQAKTYAVSHLRAPLIHFFISRNRCIAYTLTTTKHVQSLGRAIDAAKSLSGHCLIAEFHTMRCANQLKYANLTLALVRHSPTSLGCVAVILLPKGRKFLLVQD